MIKLELAETFHFPSVNIPKKAKAFINKGLVLCCVLSCVISKRTRCSSVMCSCLRLLKVKTRDSMTFYRRRLTPTHLLPAPARPFTSPLFTVRCHGGGIPLKLTAWGVCMRGFILYKDKEAGGAPDAPTNDRLRHD